MSKESKEITINRVATPKGLDNLEQEGFRDLIDRVLQHMAEWERVCAKYLQTVPSGIKDRQVRRGVFDLIRAGKDLRIESRVKNITEIPDKDSYRMVITLVDDDDREGKFRPTANRSDREKGSNHDFQLCHLSGRPFLIDPFNRRLLTAVQFEVKEDTKTDEGWPLLHDQVLTIYAQTTAEREYSVEYRVLNYLPNKAELLVAPKYTDTHKLITNKHVNRLVSLFDTIMPTSTSVQIAYRI